jgi:hypothetical protein
MLIYAPEAHMFLPPRSEIASHLQRGAQAA